MRQSLGSALRTLYYLGNNRHCPVCGSNTRFFKTYGIVPRRDAMCPVCSALERHRFIWLFLARRFPEVLKRPTRILHVAPESCFASLLARRLGVGYVTVDITRGRAMLQMDVTALGFKDGGFDFVMCNHVLEHVPDDQAAIREFHRVLRPGGRAILPVPVEGETTVEDLTITDPAERERLFGNADHVRRYGLDYSERLEACGFIVTVARVSDLIAPREEVRWGLSSASGIIHVAVKNNL